jgi:hypothetical protein
MLHFLVFSVSRIQSKSLSTPFTLFAKTQGLRSLRVVPTTTYVRGNDQPLYTLRACLSCFIPYDKVVRVRLWACSTVARFVYSMVDG